VLCPESNLLWKAKALDTTDAYWRLPST